MKIYVRCAEQPLNQMPLTLQVKRIGQYLYKHMDGAFKGQSSSDTYDVYVTLLYQLKPEFGGEVNDVQEMTININITTYANKLRVNTIEMDPMERTLGMDIIKPSEYSDLQTVKRVIQWKVGKRIRKAYADCDILF